MRPQGLPFRQCAARCWLSVTAATPSPVTAAPASTAPAAVAPTTMPTTIPASPTPAPTASPAPATAPPAADGDAKWAAPIRVGVIWIGVRIVLRCGRPRHRSKRKRGRRENCPGKGDAPKPALLGANGHYYLQLVG